MNSSPWLDWIRPSSTSVLPYAAVCKISTCWNLVWVSTRVRAMACICPSKASWSRRTTYRAAAWSTDGDRALVDDRHRRVEEHAPLHLDDRGAFGRELLDEVVGGDLRLEGFTTGEDVYRCVSVLGPGVDRQVGFRDDDDSADAERVELVKDDVDDGRLGPLRCLDQGPLDGLEVVDGVRVAVEHLEQQVSSQGIQASGPPFDPFIYRTSPATLPFASPLRSKPSKKFRL